MGSVKANRGEWSEPYVALRVLGDGKLYLADGNGDKLEDTWMDVIEVVRYETTNQIIKYKYDPVATSVVINIDGVEIASMLAADFLKVADMLKGEIISSTGRSFSVSDEITDFLKSVGIEHMKAKSVDKSDIFLSLFDSRASVTRNSIGFSIKSKLGHNPTLFNTASASGPIYKLEGMNDELMEQVNSIVDSKGKVAVLDRCRFIKERCDIEFWGYPVAKRAGCRAFEENLDLINARLAYVIAEVLKNHFFNNESDTDIEKVIATIVNNNPCKISRPEVKYPFMMKSFLYASYCGMTASTLWDGKSNVNGGFITVDEDGEVLAHYALESDSFKEYLYKHCYLEFPSTSSGHGDYGYVYKSNDEYYFKLNFQIRYK